MKSSTFRDYAVGISVIVIAITFIIFTAGYLHNASKGYKYATEFAGKFQFPAFNATTEDDLDVYATCDRLQGYYSATLEIQNYGDNEVKNINCRVIDNGGLRADSSQQSIGSLTPDSTDACTFILHGNFTKPVKFEVSYGKKSIKTLCPSFLKVED